MRTAIVILNWNGRAFLEKFLPSVIQYSQSSARIIIADNASTDDSVDFLKIYFPQIECIQNKKNWGFARGYNEALKQIDAEYYILLNSDIEVTEGWLEPLIKLMDSDNSIAACQPKLRAFHAPEKFEYAGGSGGFIDRLGYPFCRGRIFQEIETDYGQYDDAIEIFWATGACMMVRAKLYHDFKGLDGDFFAHMEEIDFCWRLKNAQYKIMVEPTSVVYHVGGGTLPKSSARKTYLNFRNNFFLLFKNLPSNRLVEVFMVRYLLDAIAAIKFLVEGHHKDFWAVTRAHLSFLRHLPTLIKKRKKQEKITSSRLYKKSIVFQHYIKKINHFSNLSKTDFT